MISGELGNGSRLLLTPSDRCRQGSAIALIVIHDHVGRDQLPDAEIVSSGPQHGCQPGTSDDYRVSHPMMGIDEHACFAKDQRGQFLFVDFPTGLT